MTQINDPKLLPCPFCGEDAAIWYYPAGERFTRKDSYYVGCTNDNCGCEMEHPGGWKTYEDAVNAWNRRAVASGLEKKSKKLEKDFGELDCRSLEDIKKLVERKADNLDGVMLDAGGVIIGLYFAIANDLPSVTPHKKPAHWIGEEYDGYADGAPVYTSWVCSECGATFMCEDMDFLYCPRCGSVMEV